MTNASLNKKIEEVVDRICDAKGYDKKSGPKGGRSTGNVLLALALEKYMPQILAECGVKADGDQPATIAIDAARKADG